MGRWRHFGLGLLGLAGLVWAGGLAVAPHTAAAKPSKTTTNPGASSFAWSTVSPPVAPPPLAFASAVYDRDNQTVVLFGGMESGGRLSNDTWVWNGFSWADHPGSDAQAPPARDQASMAFDPTLHQLILFGGVGADGQLLGDTWAWNGASWYQESGSMVSQSPSPREGAAMGYDGAGQLILFGGTGAADAAPPVDTTPSTPSTLPTSSPTANSPAVPPSTTTTAVPASGGTDLDDTWLWTANGWNLASTAAPTPRSGAAVAFDPGQGNAILFGGESMPASGAAPTWQDDTWSWDGSSWAHLTTAESPAGRAGAALTADGPRGGLVLFGGLGTSGALGDMSAWDGHAWAVVHPAGSPSPRTGAAAAFDDSTGQLVLFGGVGPTGTVLGDTVIMKTQAPVHLGPGTGSTSSSSAGSTSTSTSTATPASATSRARPADSSSSLEPATVRATPGTPSTNPPETAHHLHRGDLVTLSGQGFSPGAVVTVTFHSTPVVVGRAVANRDGDFTATVAVPQAAPAGIHQFDASGRGPTGQQVDEVIASIDVVGVPGTSTTSATEKVVLTGLALLIPLGTWFFLVGIGWWRRRRATTNQPAAG